ncbi:MAG: biotin/lipoyl-containing protein [Bacteroidaceae bacterium]|nr:biotin/lipoyl-containing protein [Bacteroidaceae bacterium]
MKRRIQFSLVYRDMFQSSGKFQPRKDQLVKVAPAIIDMGCFSRVETNGGAFEQVNLLYGENPNHAVRAFTAPFHKVGIKTHMLDRGLNALRMYPVPADVRKLMYKVKHAQGTDITRIFCGLNDVRNIIPSIQYAKEGGMTPQATLCITTSPIHTAEYYSGIADQLIAAGAEEICLKDMAGIGQPAMLGKLTAMIKKNHPNIIIQYHGHSGPGLSMASILEVCRNGADVIDTAVEPLSWGKVHPDIISVQSMLKNYGFEVADINMDAYMEVRKLTQEFIDDFLGYFMNPANKLMSSLLLGCGLPGGMMGSMMADLKGVMSAINNTRQSKGERPYSEDELLVRLFNEVAYVWPRVGYPPLVTPFSQYVKNIALMNLLTLEKGQPRFTMMDENMWGMILGRSGRLPGKVDEELVKLAALKGKEFTDADPQSYYPDALPQYEEMMKKEGWDEGPDREELFELAMHESQYRDYRSGLAKRRFEEDLEKARQAKGAQGLSDEQITLKRREQADPIVAQESGRILWEVQAADEAVKALEPYIGQTFKDGDVFCTIETSNGRLLSVPADMGGRIVEICAKQGDTVRRGDVIAYIRR